MSYREPRILVMDLEWQRPTLENGLTKRTVYFGSYCIINKRKMTRSEPITFDGAGFYQFIDSLFTDKNQFIYAHYGMMGDFPEIIASGVKRGYAAEGTFYGMKLQNAEGHSIILFDTATYYRKSLNSIREAFGLPTYEYREDDLDYMAKKNVEDTKVLADFLLGVARKIKQETGMTFLGRPRSLNNLLFSVFLKEAKKKGINRWDFYFDRWEDKTRPAYTGARNEVFQIYGKNVVQYDKNTMYGNIMEQVGFPYQKKAYTRLTNPTNIEALIEAGIMGIVNATVRNNVRKDLSYLWVRDARGTLYFVHGDKWYTGWYTFMEAKKFLEHGYDVKFNEAIAYLGDVYRTDMFRRAHENRLKAKSMGDLYMADLFKRLTCSTYGKFGQKTIRITRTILPQDKLAELDKEANVRPLEGGYAMVETKKVEPNVFRNYFAAAQITAAARILLTDVLDKLIARNGIENIYYCDNDAVFLSDTADTHGILSIGDGFEQWKIAATYDEIEFYTEKMFSARSGGKLVEKRKGILGPATLSGNMMIERREAKIPIDKIRSLDDFAEFREVVIAHQIYKYRRDVRRMEQYNIADILRGG